MLGGEGGGEDHVLDDMQIFGRALKKYVQESLEAMSPEQKNAVYRHVYDLAIHQRGAPTGPMSDPRWGEQHALDNIPRLIDAMQKIVSGQMSHLQK
jgi:hypothetical protein